MKRKVCYTHCIDIPRLRKYGLYSGYSVFAVVQADPSKPLALPRTEADSLAATVDAPDSSQEPSSASGSSTPGAILEHHEDIEIPEDKEYTLDEEDLELQAALQASITGRDNEYGQEPYVLRPPVPAPALRQAPLPPPLENTGNPDEDDTSDPMAASLARQRATLEHMRRIQEAALRETYDDEVTNFGRPAQRRRTEQDEEADLIRQAIAASIAEHGGAEVNDDDDDENDADWRPENEDELPIRRGPPVGPTPPSVQVGGPSGGHRVYDDEDAELQAALRASLESAPEGYVHPPTPPPRRPTLPVPSASAESESSSTTAVSQEPEPMQVDDDEDDTETERFTSPPPVEQKPDMDEIRRRRW